MKIKTKLRLGVLAMLIFTFIIGIVFCFMAGETEISTQKGGSADRVIMGAYELNMVTQAYVSSRSERAKTQWLSRHASLKRLIQKEEETFTAEEEREIIRRLLFYHQGMKALVGQILENAEKLVSLPKSERGLLKESDDRLLAQLRGKTQEMVSEAMLLTAMSEKEIRMTQKKLVTSVMSLIVFMIVGIGILSITLYKNIAVSLEKLRAGTEIIAGGNLDYRVKNETKDEIGILAKAFNEMAGELRSSYAALEKEVEGRKQAQEELIQLHRDLEKRVEERTADLVRSEAALRENEERLRLAQESGNVGVWDSYPQTGEQDYSPQMYKIYGLEEGTIRRYEDWRQRVHPDDIAGVEAARDAAMARHERFDLEYRIFHGSGEVRWINSKGGAMYNEAGEITRVLGVTVDITEYKRAEETIRQRTMELQQLTETLEERVRERTAELTAEIEHRKLTEEALLESQKELRYLSSQLLVGQEKERKEVAENLHDNIWQILNTIRWKIEVIFSGKGKGGLSDFHGRSQQIVSDIRNVVERIRAMQGDLWPPVLDDIGILATINWYCREFEKSHWPVCIEKQVDLAEDDVPAPVKIVIYRVMQEALENVSRHSRASSVALGLHKKDHKIEFTLKDNGVGFDLKKVLRGRMPWVGLGLVSMRERTEHTGGSFEIESSNGSGTTIRASWPIGQS